MKLLTTTLLLTALTAPAMAQSVDTPGIDDGRTLGSVFSDFATTPGGGRAIGEHSRTSDGNGDQPGRTGLARIGNDLSDTIDAIDGD